VVLHFTPRQIRLEPAVVAATIKTALSNVRTDPVGIRTLPALQAAG
jgi:ABC-type molybdate transport system substrate-binding protein